MIEVILLEPVTKLGKFGEFVKVKPGFARNYLVPQGKALPATQANKKSFETRRARLESEQMNALAVAKRRAEQLQALGVISLPVKAGEEGKLFGSVTLRDIEKHLTQLGFEAQKQELKMEGKNLRALGEYAIRFSPHSQVETQFMLQLVALVDPA